MIDSAAARSMAQDLRRQREFHLSHAVWSAQGGNNFCDLPPGAEHSANCPANIESNAHSLNYLPPHHGRIHWMGNKWERAGSEDPTHYRWVFRGCEDKMSSLRPFTVESALYREVELPSPMDEHRHLWGDFARPLTNGELRRENRKAKEANKRKVELEKIKAGIATYPSNVLELMWRDGFMCQAKGMHHPDCENRSITGYMKSPHRDPAESLPWDRHHLTPRAAGGSNDLDNLILTTRQCHQKIHNNERQAVALGLMTQLSKKSTW